MWYVDKEKENKERVCVRERGEREEREREKHVLHVLHEVLSWTKISSAVEVTLLPEAQKRNFFCCILYDKKLFHTAINYREVIIAKKS